MLLAHIVPGYFGAVYTQVHENWTPPQKRMLWVVAIGSTIAPDTDVIYNALFQGFVNHSTLYTHSLFTYLPLVLLWFLMRHFARFAYVRTLIGLVAVGGLSHLLLDVIAHNTPLFYPLSTQAIGIAPRQIVEGGIIGYLTHPLFLLEPLLLATIFVDWLYHYREVKLQIEGNKYEQ